MTNYVTILVHESFFVNPRVQTSKDVMIIINARTREEEMSKRKRNMIVGGLNDVS
jgi:hypothetical protein